MHKAYISAYGTTIVREENKEKNIKETNNKMEEELLLENEIEIIEENIASLNQEKDKLDTIDNNKKFINKCYGIAAAIFIGVISLVKFCLPLINPTIELPKKILPFIHTNNDFTFYMMILVTMFFTLPFYCVFPKEIKSKIKRIKIIEEQLEFLNEELLKKQKELTELKTTSQKITETDGEVHILDNDSYRNKLKERLTLLSYIKKYRNKLKTYLANGTLTEELRKLEIEPENILFVEETLKRVLEKEKVTQHE